MMRTLLVPTLLSFVAVAAGAEPLRVTLDVVPPVSLPGIPVAAVLTVTNSGAAAVSVPSSFVVRVSNEEGDSFLAAQAPEFAVRTLPAEYAGMRSLAAGETRTFEIPLASALTDGVMGDERLWRPGRFAVQVLLHDELRVEDVIRFGVDGLLAAGRIGSPLSESTVATLRIDAPVGADARVWHAIVDETGRRGLARIREKDAAHLAGRLWSDAEQSAYWPYLLAYVRVASADEGDVLINRVVARDPDHPVAQVMRLGRATAKARQAETMLDQGRSLEDAIRITSEARHELEELSRHAASDLVRRRSSLALANVKTAEQLRARRQ